ncbi:signal peptidase II [Moraxella nasibovis]|uniref:signal peptidase II n=1 Tax=Moraxella nasibovis TaxID=2904120 RepID=UPI00240FA92A|nr:signal peptidase II [Moraxella nasibovis]WFF38156.1 signal peptidase II [Moraxella nasibovis]
MPNTTLPNGNKAMGYYLIALVVLIFDQITKVYFNTRFELYETVDVISPVLNWTLAYNRGAAFSFLADQAGWQKWFFVILGLAVAVFIIRYLRQIPKSAKVLSLGLALVLGGAVGNVIDRILYGYVIDFIHVHWYDIWHYPIFNTADIGICVGMALVVYDMLFLEKKREQNH